MYEEYNQPGRSYVQPHFYPPTKFMNNCYLCSIKTKNESYLSPCNTILFSFYIIYLQYLLYCISALTFLHFFPKLCLLFWGCMTTVFTSRPVIQKSSRLMIFYVVRAKSVLVHYYSQAVLFVQIRTHQTSFNSHRQDTNAFSSFRTFTTRLLLTNVNKSVQQFAK